MEGRGEAVRVLVESEAAIVNARQKGRELAAELGLSSTDSTVVATAISELARNILRYAKRGEIILRLVQDGNKRGLMMVAHDEGPGISDVERALQGGYSTSGSLGLGLAGVRRLMDEIVIVSEVGKGTTVTVKKWKR